MTLEMVIQRYRDSHTDGWSFDHGRHFRKQDNETTLWCFNFLPTYFCLSAANLSVDVEHKIWETNCGKLVRQYTCTVFNTLLVQHLTQIIRLLGYVFGVKKIRNKSHKSWTYLFDMQYGFALRNADIEMLSRKVSFNNPTLQTQTKPNVL